MSRFRPLVSIPLVFVALAATQSTHAAEPPRCDPACPRGYVCALEEGCAELDEIGEPCEPAPTCQPLDCMSDAECDEFMECYQEQGPTEPGICLPNWHLSCDLDADCGEGFTCTQRELCRPMDGGSSPSPEGENVCDGSEEKLCFVHTRACEQDSDCWSGWTCENNPLNAYIADTNGGAWCGISEPALICEPPHAFLFGLGAGYLDWRNGVQWEHHLVPEAECLEPRERDSGAPSGSTNAGSGDEPPTGSEPSAGSHSDDQSEDAGSHDSDVRSQRAVTDPPPASEGCSLHAGRLSSAWTMMGWLALVGWLRRRR